MAEKKKRKQWKDNDMRSAMSDVNNKEMTIYAAAASFNVPRKTLDDRIKGLVRHGTNPGPSTALTFEQENALESYLFYMAEHGYPLTRTMVKAYGWAIAKRSGSGDRFNEEFGPGDKWWANFKKRHPKVSLRRVDMLERTRAEALNPKIVDEYFDLLGTTLDNLGLKNKPRHIYNCDETFLPLDCNREKAVTYKGAKNTYCQSYGTSEHITLLCCASAAGIPHPPMIIYSKSFPGGQYRFEGPEDTLYARSESGWIDTELYLAWMKKFFLKFIVPERPVLLLTDGHKTHINIDVIDLCRDNGISLFCLPPHTTHALQPLDVAVFKSLKDSFAKAVRALSFTKKNFIVTKREFARVVKRPLDQAFAIANVKAGFSKWGIYPFNPNAIAIKKMTPSQVYQSIGSTSDSLSDGVLESSVSESSRPPSVIPSSTESQSRSPSPDSITAGATAVTQETVSITTGPVSLSSSASVMTTSSASVPHVTRSSSTPVASTTTSPSTVTCFSPVNPLVAAGLVPEDLSDILITPPVDAAVTKERTKRIVGARHLTADEYVQMVKDIENKKREAEELKEKKKAERDMKKAERERTQKEKLEQQAARKKEREEKKKQHEREKKKGKKRNHPTTAKVPRARRVLRLESDDSDGSDAELVESLIEPDCPEIPETDLELSDAPEPESMDDSTQPEPPEARASQSARPRRSGILPARFRDDVSDDDGILCDLCQLKEPPGMADNTVFWVDCDSCGKWVHNYCAFKKNAVSKRFKCDECSS